jgi:hypothetical protein
VTRRTLILIRIAWLAATCAVAAAWKGEALILLVPLAALGPILKEVAPSADVDERQRLVDYRASHVALIVTYLLIFVLFARSWFQLKHEPSNELWLLLVAPLLVRTGIAVGQGFGARKLALILGFVCGAFWLAFSTASHGLSPESAIGGSIIAFTALGIRWPRLGGALLLVVASAFLVFFVARGPARQDWVQFLLMTAALPLPPLLAGLGLIGSAVRTARPPSDEFSDLRRTQ